MKTVWMRNDGSDELLLFFNGWGMDHRIAAFLFGECGNSFTGDFLACHDYRSLLPQTDFHPLRQRYRRITLVAWSFGVWAARYAGPAFVDRAIAINGTLHPVSDTDGIPPDVFHATLSGYSDENRQRFNRRMCGGGKTLVLFEGMSPERETSDQLQELECFREHLQSDYPRPVSWHYDHAIIGEKDLVFPARHQLKAWQDVPRTVIPGMPHFPFNQFRNLTEVLACLC
jgi:pimeloyl-[acyl-carrier protein] methyl ester esterase